MHGFLDGGGVCDLHKVATTVWTCKLSICEARPVFRGGSVTAMAKDIVSAHCTSSVQTAGVVILVIKQCGMICRSYTVLLLLFSQSSGASSHIRAHFTEAGAGAPHTLWHLHTHQHTHRPRGCEKLRSIFPTAAPIVERSHELRDLQHPYKLCTLDMAVS